MVVAAATNLSTIDALLPELLRAEGRGLQRVSVAGQTVGSQGVQRDQDDVEVAGSTGLRSVHGGIRPDRQGEGLGLRREQPCLEAKGGRSSGVRIQGDRAVVPAASLRRVRVERLAEDLAASVVLAGLHAEGDATLIPSGVEDSDPELEPRAGRDLDGGRLQGALRGFRRDDGIDRQRQRRSQGAPRQVELDRHDRLAAGGLHPRDERGKRLPAAARADAAGRG